MINFIKKPITILMFVVAIGFYLLNMYAPLMVDDYFFRYIFGTEELVKNFHDIVVTEIIYYFQRGGRVPAQVLTQLALLYPKIIFNVINTLTFIAMFIGLYININPKLREERKVTTMMLILFLFWFGIPRFAQTTIWINGSLTYLRASVFFLFFTYYFKKVLLIDDTNSYSKVKYVLLFLFGLITGWSNENMVVGVFVTCVIYLLYYRKSIMSNLVKIKKLVSMFIGFCLGGLLLIIAPGNFVRSGMLSVDTWPSGTISDVFLTSIENIHVLPSNEKISAISKLTGRLNYYLGSVNQLLRTSLVIFVVLCIVLVLLLIFENKNIDRILKEYYFEFVVAIVSLISMIATFYFPMRANFITMLYVIIFTVNLILELIEKKSIKYFMYVNVIIGILIFISYVPMLKNYKEQARLEKDEQVSYGRVILLSNCGNYAPDNKFLPALIESTSIDELIKLFNKNYKRNILQPERKLSDKDIEAGIGNCGIINLKREE